jgi:toxin CcdB
MERFNVYPNPSGKGYLLNVQADMLDHLASRLVIPLLPLEDAPPPTRKLHPVFEVNGQKCLLATQAMAGIPLKHLKQPVCNLRDRYDEIVAAIDFLLNGF